MKMIDLADVIAPGCKHEIIGIRPGEKLHEMLVSRDESRHTLELSDMFIIQPVHPWWQQPEYEAARPMEKGTKFSSDKNDRWLTQDELRQMVAGT
jgi:UDP-N-acetylglucosamine 4,6-dehydratase